MAHKKIAKKDEFTIRENKIEPNANIDKGTHCSHLRLSVPLYNFFSPVIFHYQYHPLGLPSRGCPVLAMAAGRDEVMIKML